MLISAKDELSSAVFTFLFIVLTLLCLRLVVNKSKKSSAPLPPGPRGLPFVGYLPFLDPNLHRHFTSLSKLYGRIYKLWLGNKLCIVISSPSLVKEIVRDQDTVFSNRDPPIAAVIATYGGNDIAFSSQGPEWKKLRKLFVREMLSNTSLEACSGLRRQEIKKTLKDLYLDRAGYEAVEIGELAFATTVNMVMNMVWGGTFRSEMEDSGFKAELKEKVTDIMWMLAAPNVSDYLPWLARFDIQGIEKRAIEVLKWFDHILDSAITLRQNSATAHGEGKEMQRKDFLQLLLELKESGGASNSITTAQLKSILLDMVVGGTDTTATTVEWAMSELMQHPEVMDKVYQELDEVVGLNDTVEETHFTKLQYLQCVIKETLRFHPPVPLLIPHCPSKNTVVGGYTIPKGTNVFLNIWAIHRSPEFWDNPLEFVPERFLEDSGKFDFRGNNLQYLPFGSGRRKCPGLPLAEKMLMYVLASFLHSFSWRLPDGEEVDLEDEFGLVVKKKNPLMLIPNPRLSEELYV